MDALNIKNANGFTLVEFIVVLVIIGILSLMVIIQWPASAINVGAEANQVANDVRYTQSLAMTRGKRFYLIKLSSNTYQIRDSAGNPVTMAFGNTTVTLNSGISFGTLSNLPSNLIAFDAVGAPYTTSSSPGTALASTATIPLTSGSTTVTVSILAVTGRVTVA